MSWREVTILEAIAWAKEREDPSLSVGFLPEGVPHTGGVGAPNADEYLLFTDGSCIAVSSAWYGPYSAETPDMESCPPRWWIWNCE